MTHAEFETTCDIITRTWPKWERFNYCQAWITSGNYHYNGKLYKLVKSYATIVGIIDVSDGLLWWDKKYSTTTSRHLTDISKLYHLSKRRTEA